MKELFIVRAEITPSPRSILYREDPAVRGAFVDCIILADHLEEAHGIAKNMLKEDGYDLIQFTETGRYDEFTFSSPDLEVEYENIRKDVIESGKPAYGTFHCYYNDCN